MIPALQVVTRFFCFIVVTMCLAVSCLAQSASPIHPEPKKDLLKSFLQSYVGPATEETKPHDIPGPLRLYAVMRTQQIVVYLTSDGWCGSGGCRMLVLDPKGSSYKVVAHIPTVRLPISVLTAKSSGWHDIRVSRQVPVLSFDLPSQARKTPEVGSFQECRHTRWSVRQVARRLPVGRVPDLRSASASAGTPALSSFPA